MAKPQVKIDINLGFIVVIILGLYYLRQTDPRR